MTNREQATLADRLWEWHVVDEWADGSQLLYIDLHLLHEVSSPQAFEALRTAGRRVRRPDLTVAVEDHNVPTDSPVIRDDLSRAQVQALRDNCAEHGIELHRFGDRSQGIVHVIAPELGLIHPGMTIACGDSHTSTLGAFGVLAFGIGTSDVEHVLATQTLILPRPRNMAVRLRGAAQPGVTPKDVMLALMTRIGANGARGHVIEYDGEFTGGLSMEGRMTLCNMTVEAGAAAGLIAPDATTFDYLRCRRYAPPASEWDKAAAGWRRLRTSPGAEFSRTVDFDVSRVVPFVTWGTNPGQAVPIDGTVPDPGDLADADARAAARRAMDYMGVRPGTSMRDLRID
ncbi:MAG: aconitase family protein, partial [Trebonia sp.]